MVTQRNLSDHGLFGSLNVDAPKNRLLFTLSGGDYRPILAPCTSPPLPKPATQTTTFGVSWTSACDPKRTFAFGHCGPITAGSLRFSLMSPNAMGAVIKASLKAPELGVHFF